MPSFQMTGDGTFKMIRDDEGPTKWVEEKGDNSPQPIEHQQDFTDPADVPYMKLGQRPNNNYGYYDPATGDFDEQVSAPIMTALNDMNNRRWHKEHENYAAQERGRQRSLSDPLPNMELKRLYGPEYPDPIPGDHAGVWAREPAWKKEILDAYKSNPLPLENAPPLPYHPSPSITSRAREEYNLSDRAMDRIGKTDVKFAPNYLVGLEMDKDWDKSNNPGGFYSPMDNEIMISMDYGPAWMAEALTHEGAHAFYNREMNPIQKAAWIDNIRQADRPMGPAPRPDTDEWNSWYGNQRPGEALEVVSGNINRPNTLYSGKTAQLGTETYAGIAGTMKDDRLKYLDPKFASSYYGFFDNAPKPSKWWLR